jgi:hypothetical protein
LDACTWQQLLPVLVTAWQPLVGCSSSWSWSCTELLLLLLLMQQLLGLVIAAS